MSISMEEIWLPIPGFEHCGEVSNLGRIKSKAGVIRKTVIANNGYVRVGLKKIDGKNTNYVTVHRLVAIAFCGGFKDDYCVNHIDGNKQNNQASNLEWCSYSHNALHAFRLGLRTANARIVIPYEDREEILAARSRGVTFREIGEKYGVCHSSVVHYVYGRKHTRSANHVVK